MNQARSTISRARNKAWRKGVKVMKSGGFLNLIEFSKNETSRGVDHDLFADYNWQQN